MSSVDVATKKTGLNWTLNANYKFTDKTPSNPGGPDFSSGCSNRLDLTLAKNIAKGKSELMFGVSDLLAKHREGASSLTSYTVHDTPGRMFFTRLQLKF